MIPYQIFNPNTLFDELQQFVWELRARQLEEARAENARLKAALPESGKVLSVAPCLCGK